MILYFTSDLSEENQAFAKENGLIIRDVSAYREGDFIEQCDAVFGDVPKAYLDKYQMHEIKQKTTEKKPTTRTKE